MLLDIASSSNWITRTKSMPTFLSTDHQLSSNQPVVTSSQTLSQEEEKTDLSAPSRTKEPIIIPSKGTRRISSSLGNFPISSAPCSFDNSSPAQDSTAVVLRGSNKSFCVSAANRAPSCEYGVIANNIFDSDSESESDSDSGSVSDLEPFVESGSVAIAGRAPASFLSSFFKVLLKMNKKRPLFFGTFGLSRKRPAYLANRSHNATNDSTEGKSEKNSVVLRKDSSSTHNASSNSRSLRRLANGGNMRSSSPYNNDRPAREQSTGFEIMNIPQPYNTHALIPTSGGSYPPSQFANYQLTAIPNSVSVLPATTKLVPQKRSYIRQANLDSSTSKKKLRSRWSFLRSPNGSLAPWVRELPTIIIGYVQLLWNMAILGVIGFVAWKIYSAIKKEMDHLAGGTFTEIMSKIEQCSHDYKENNCGTEPRLPALQDMCREWEACMSRDPHNFSHLLLAVNSFAELADSFVQKLSIKTIAFVILFVLAMQLVNSMLSRLRRPNLIQPRENNYDSQFITQRQRPRLNGSPVDTRDYENGYSAATAAAANFNLCSVAPVTPVYITSSAPGSNPGFNPYHQFIPPPYHSQAHGQIMGPPFPNYAHQTPGVIFTGATPAPQKACTTKQNSRRRNIANK